MSKLYEISRFSKLGIMIEIIECVDEMICVEVIIRKYEKCKMGAESHYLSMKMEIEKSEFGNDRFREK